MRMRVRARVRLMTTMRLRMSRMSSRRMRLPMR